MSGQSASLTIKEACAMQERVQASGSHACNNGGSGSSKKMSMGKASGATHRKKKEMMEQ
jgi:hypothetical protein